MAGDRDFWQNLREMTLPFFAGNDALWRLSVKSTAAPFDCNGPSLIDWGGALRWLRGNPDAAGLRRYAALAGGSAIQFAGGDRSAPLRSPPDPVTRRLHERLKQAFDPQGILNPGRLYDFL